MKIAYVAAFGNRFFNGVFRKIESQLAVWKTLPGVEVSLFFRAIPGLDVPGSKSYPIWGIPTGSYNTEMFRDIVAFDPDIIYLRHEIAGPQILQIAKRFSGKIILEINADIDAELKLESQASLKRRAAFWINKATSGYLEKHLGGCVCVSSNFIKLFPRVPCERKIVSPNVIDLAQHPVCKRAPTSTERTALLFVGTPSQAWHGVDMLPHLARSLPEYDFHVVGPDALADAPPNMSFYGYLPPPQLSRLYTRSHIGIGSLAFFRKNISEASPLKVREYIAAGLPVILGCADSAFLDHTPSWVCYTPSSEWGGDKPEILMRLRSFVAENATKIVSHQESTPYIDAVSFEKRKIATLQSWFSSSQ